MTFTVDTHHHILPDFFFQATNETGHPAGGVAPAPWSRANMLSFLDEAGIDVAVISISTRCAHRRRHRGPRTGTTVQRTGRRHDQRPP